MKRSIIILIIGFLFLFFSCKKPFSLSAIPANTAYLVVEGVLNSGSDSTIVKLSRTIRLDSINRIPEHGASVSVESDKNDQYLLNETVSGTYITTNLNLPTDRNYRLHIRTSQGKEYLSDYVENKITPPIDTISYKPLKTGVEFLISSHDNSNKTRYYRWDYDETWSYFAVLASQLTYKDGVISFTNPDSLHYACYMHAIPSNSIFITSTDKLAKDVVSNALLGYTDASTGKLTHVYSLLVKQYALTAEAYKYWQLLKTNTEQLGTIFDTQPSSSITNIHAVDNPNEPVVGYISVSTVTSKRIFVQGINLPPFVLQVVTGVPSSISCAEPAIYIQPIESFDSRLRQILFKGDSLLTIADTDPATGLIDKYFYAPAICVDCRLQGGTSIKPSYWPF